MLRGWVIQMKRTSSKQRAWMSCLRTVPIGSFSAFSSANFFSSANTFAPIPWWRQRGVKHMTKHITSWAWHIKELWDKLWCSVYLKKKPQNSNVMFKQEKQSSQVYKHKTLIMCSIWNTVWICSHWLCPTYHLTVSRCHRVIQPSFFGIHQNNHILTQRVNTVTSLGQL